VALSLSLLLRSLEMPATIAKDGKLRIMIDQIKWLEEEDIKTLIIEFVRTFSRDFVLAWAVRGGVGFLPHLLKLLNLKRCQIICGLF
jgi:hypothetical protein